MWRRQPFLLPLPHLRLLLSLQRHLTPILSTLRLLLQQPTQPLLSLPQLPTQPLLPLPLLLQRLRLRTPFGRLFPLMPVG